MGLFKRRKVDPEIQVAYDTAYREERLKLAAERGKAKAHAKPFYQKLVGFGERVAKDVSSPSKRKRKSAGLMLEEMAFGSPTPKRKRRQK